MTQVEREDRGSDLSPVVALLASVTLFGVAMAVRALPWGHVFIAGQVVPRAGDSFYHLRRIAYSAANFPAELTRDAYINFPLGAEVHWGPLFDWPLAALVRLIYGAQNPEAAEHLLVWVAPVLGSITVVGAAWLAWRVFGGAAGVLTGLLLAFLPAHFEYTQLGEIDHHVAVSFVTLGILALGCALVREKEGHSPSYLLAVLLGFGFASALLVWSGSLIHVVVAQFGLTLWLLVAETRTQAASRAKSLAILHGVTWLVLAPFTLGKTWEFYGNYNPMVLSQFHPLFFGAAFLSFALLPWLWSLARAESAGWRAAVGAILAVAGVGGSFLLFPALGEALGSTSQVWAKEDPWVGTIWESQPMLWRGGRVDWNALHVRMSFLGYVFPFAWMLLAWQTARGRRGAECGLLLLWSAVFCVATLSQLRFVNTFSVVFAVVVAGALGPAVTGGLDLLGKRWRLAGIAVTGLLLFVCLLPVWPYYRMPWTATWLALNGEPVPVTPVITKVLAYDEAARWLRKNTPATGGYLDRDETPEYGVLCNWGYGHQTRYRSQRPMIQDNFGSFASPENYALAGAYYAATSEEEAVELLDKGSIRFVIAEPHGSGHGTNYTYRSMTRRFEFLRGSAGRVPDPATRRQKGVPALTRHRLVFDAGYHARTARGGTRARPLGIYERVSGALIEGASLPESKVRASIPIRLSRGDTFDYSVETVADSEGRYQLRVPYATGHSSKGGGVAATGPYVLSSEGSESSLDVSEAAVIGGLSVVGPTFDCVGEQGCLPD